MEDENETDDGDAPPEPHTVGETLAGIIKAMQSSTIGLGGILTSAEQSKALIDAMPKVSPGLVARSFLKSQPMPKMPPNPVYEQIEETRTGLANVAEILQSTAAEISAMAALAQLQLDAQGDLVAATAAVQAETKELRTVTRAGQDRADKSDRTIQRLNWAIALLTVAVVVLAVLQVYLTIRTAH